MPRRKHLPPMAMGMAGAMPMPMPMAGAMAMGVAIMAVGVGCTPGGGERPVRVVERVVDPVAAPRDAALLRAAMIAGHAAARAAVGVPPLAWDDALVASAQDYVDTLARTGRFQHAVQPMDARRQGENLWTGSRGAYRYAEMVGHWLAERSDLVDAPTPAFSRSGDWHRVGHYTQIVWRGTTRFGCALASDARADYLVCRYSPAGNVMGQRAL